MYQHRFELKAGEWFAPPIDPSDELDYQLIFDKLLTDDDEITDVQWSVAPVGITIVDAKTTNTETTATVWLTEATAGSVFTVTATVGTLLGRTIQRSFKIVCRNR